MSQKPFSQASRQGSSITLLCMLSKLRFGHTTTKFWGLNRQKRVPFHSRHPYVQLQGGTLGAHGSCIQNDVSFFAQLLFTIFSCLAFSLRRRRILLHFNGLSSFIQIRSVEFLRQLDSSFCPPHFRHRRFRTMASNCEFIQVWKLGNAVPFFIRAPDNILPPWNRRLSYPLPPIRMKASPIFPPPSSSLFFSSLSPSHHFFHNACPVGSITRF